MKKLEYKGITNKVYSTYKKLVEAEETDKSFMNKIYKYVAEQLYFKGGYEENEIQHFFGEKIYPKLQPDYYQDETYYLEHENINQYTQYLFENMDDEMEETIQDNTELMENLLEFQEVVNNILSPDNETQKEVVDKVVNNPKQRIKNLLKKVSRGLERGTKEQVITELVELLEKEEKMFSVEFPDEKQPDGYKSRYYYIDPETNSYERNTKNRLKKIFNEKYDITLHKSKHFYYDILERIYTSMEEQKHIVEMENIYIDRRNFKIIPKTDDNIIFTTDRLTYTTYDTQKQKLFHYDDNITLDDLLNGSKKMTFPMERIKEMFVPKTKPEETQQLRMFLQYMGLMIMGRNPVKLILLLYDLEDERVGNKGRTTLFHIMKTCFPSSFVRIGKEVFKDQFKIETYSHGRHGVYMDEIDKDTLIKHHTEIKELINGSGNSGGAMYTREQKEVESLPLLIGSNGIPEPPLSDSAFLSRLLPMELPNQFVDDTKVKEDTDTYPKISNLDDMIQQHVDELGQVISVSINEFLKFDLTKSLDNQFAIQPNIDRTIHILTQNNVVLGLLNTYTDPGARSKKEWVTPFEIQTRIAEAYKRATGNDMDKVEYDEAKIGMLLKQLYPDFMSQKGNKKRSDKTRYNIKLYTYNEVQQQENEMLEVYPLGEMKLFNSMENMVYNQIRNGNNTIKKLQKELTDEQSYMELDETLESLHNKGLIGWTKTQNFVE